MPGSRAAPGPGMTFDNFVMAVLDTVMTARTNVITGLDPVI